MQTVVSRKQAALNHIAFNPVEPVVIVGDSRGLVHTLKAVHRHIDVVLIMSIMNINIPFV